MPCSPGNMRGAGRPPGGSMFPGEHRWGGSGRIESPLLSFLLWRPPLEPSVPTWSLDTLKQGIRQPGPWILLALGVGAGWSGLRLAILALGEWDTQAPALIQSTALLTGALTTLWVCARLLDEDARSQLCLAADGTTPGFTGRLLGRWMGAALLGIAACTIVGALLQILATRSIIAPGESGPSQLWLHSTNIGTLALTAGWGLLLTQLLRGTGALVAGVLLWGAAHLPWGAPGLLAGRSGAALSILLPGPRPPGDPACWLPATAAALAAILLLAISLGGRPRLRR